VFFRAERQRRFADVAASKIDDHLLRAGRGSDGGLRRLGGALGRADVGELRRREIGNFLRLVGARPVELRRERRMRKRNLTPADFNFDRAAGDKRARRAGWRVGVDGGAAGATLIGRQATAMERLAGKSRRRGKR
jgi:hypothetical protein